MDRFVRAFALVVAFVSLSGCLIESRQPLGGSVVRTSEIGFLQEGARLYSASSGALSYFVRSLPGHKLRIWTWNSGDEEWKESMDFDTFVSSMENYYIARTRADSGQGYSYFGYLIGDETVQVVHMAAGDALEVARWSQVDAALVGMLNGRPPRGADGEPVDVVRKTYNVEEHQPSQQQARRSTQEDTARSRSGGSSGTATAGLRVGDSRYMQGLFSDIVVDVLEIDRGSGTVRVRRRDDGTTEWVSASRLISRNQAIANDVGRGALALGAIVCLFDPDCGNAQ